MVTAVTSAFGDPTRRDIYLFARSRAEVTAAEVAGRFDLHSNVARHHLDKLAAGGYLEVMVGRAVDDELAPAGRRGAGRPSKRYRAAGEGTEALAFPPRRDDLLVALLNRALGLLEPGQAECLAEAVGEEYGRSLAAHLGPAQGQRSLRAALQTVAEALTAHGFAAHAEVRGASLAVVSDHCPFGGAAVVHPVICAVDRGMVRGMLAGLSGLSIPVTMSSRARGDDACAAVV